MEQINWKVDGISCANCVLTIRQYLEKEGVGNVQVNMMDGDVSFLPSGNTPADKLQKGIEALGYTVHTGKAGEVPRKKIFKNHKQRFLFCLIFTLPLMLHMFHNVLPIHWLMNPWVQLALTLPVLTVGMDYFGRSAVQSLKNGIPNMNVLVTIGALAAFVYSLIGAINQWGHDYLFFETTATIITLVFMGNWLEETSVQSTQKALNQLAKSQKVMANMIAFDGDHQEVIFPIENTQLKHGDLILIKSGEQVPADVKILTGSATVNESIITGESEPIAKNIKDQLIGGSILIDGNVRAQVIAEAKDSVLANILNLVRQAQSEKAPVQQLADKISAVFVPVVLSIAALTLLINYLVAGAFTPSIMRAIAVLVIACPCAMGLATPAAIAVGLGRAAKNGVLFRNARSLELFKNIQQVVFDKTGTLTTGNFNVADYRIIDQQYDEHSFKQLVYSLEKYSNHPIAVSITQHWKASPLLRWKKVEEVKGVGMQAWDEANNFYQAGSYDIAKELIRESYHNVYILKNGVLIGWIDVKDEIRAEAKEVVDYLKSKGIKTILLSGDRKEKCAALAEHIRLDEVIAEKKPAEKLAIIESLTKNTPTAMVGDGINDAPALAKATIGISLSDASHVAMQTADVVLMNHGIKNLPLALGLGKHTYKTIQQNLFWAFIYNIIAIPIAAVGLLQPMFAALVMGLSDVVLGINSVRLFKKKVL
jgi:Cu+-exporting ATPase